MAYYPAVLEVAIRRRVHWLWS